MFPTPYTVQRQAFTPGVVNSHGEPRDAWAAAVDVEVHGWAPPTADREPAQANRTAVIRDLDLLAPVGTVMRPRDRVTVATVTYEVVGHPEDYSGGPWGWDGGIVINLRRVEG